MAVVMTYLSFLMTSALQVDHTVSPLVPRDGDIM